MKLDCGECSHSAEISSPSDSWKCNCWAGTSSDPGCGCDAMNFGQGIEDNPPDTARSEINQLTARLVELQGGVEPTGVVE